MKFKTKEESILKMKENYRSLYRLPFARFGFEHIFRPLFSIMLRYHPYYKYNSLGLICSKNCDFINNPRFIEAWNKKVELTPNANAINEGKWINHVHTWAITNAMNLEGDFVECGVDKGNTPLFNITYLGYNNIKNRKYYLFDTFKGLDENVSSKEELNNMKGQFIDCYDFVKNTFKDYPNVILVKGTIPESLEKVNIKKIAYLHIDLNSAYPERKALEFFWDKMVKGSIIILDDYGWMGFEEQKISADEFAKSKGVEILHMPTGQGVIIKP